MKDNIVYKELEKVLINGIDQWISIRAMDLNNPILLFLHGGPGGSEISSAYIHYGKSKLENKFILVNWDQRGSGKSFSKNINSDSMNIRQLVDDGIEVVKHLMKKFNKNKIYLVGHSWGSILGMKMIERDSNLFFAYISISQLVNMKLSEKRSLDIAISLANELKNKRAISELQALKEFNTQNNNYLKYMDIHRSWLAKLGGLYYSKKRINPSMLFIAALFSPEYKLNDVVKLKDGLNFSIRYMWGEIMNINLLENIVNYDIPIYFIVGKNDNISYPDLIDEYFKKIIAPKKEIIYFKESGHSPHFEEWDKYENTVIQLFNP